MSTSTPHPSAGEPDPAGVAGGPVPAPSEPQPFPLLVSDPPRIGDFWLDARLTARESGVVYIGHADDQPSVLIAVLGEGASRDAAARDRLAGEVNKLHAETVVARGGDGQDGGRLADKYRSEADDPVAPGDPPVAPWVALAYDGSPAALAEADRLLRTVDLSSTPMLGRPAGPDYRLHWLDQSQPGAWRLWPMSWPGRHDRAGWIPFAVSWGLMIWLAGLALLIAVLLFQNSPPESPQPPVPTDQQSQEQSPQSGDPSEPQSQDPSSASGDPSSSPSDSESASPSDSESASPSDSGSQSGSPTSGSPSQSQDPSSPGGTGSPSRDPSMGVSGSGDATDTQPPPPVNTKL